jgi:hypothetical protein
MSRRTYALGLALVVLAVTSGCLNVQDRYEAAPVTVGDDALAEAGYNAAGAETISRTESDIRGTSKNVTVVSYARSYSRNVTGPAGEARPLAALVTVSTPSITVANQEFNPVADQSPRQLLDRFRGRVDERFSGGRVRDVSRAGNRTATILGAERRVAQFSATTTVEGVEVPLVVEATGFEHDGDYVILFAAYPEQLADEERPRVGTLLGGLEHGGSSNG